MVGDHACRRSNDFFLGLGVPLFELQPWATDQAHSDGYAWANQPNEEKLHG